MRALTGPGLTVAVTASALLFTAGCATTFTAADRGAIEGVLQAQVEAWNRGDLEAFMEGYARRPDIVFTSGAKVRRGFEETLTKYREAYGDADAMGTLAFEVLELTPLGAGGAVMLGRWTLTETPKAATGLFTLVWERTDAGWRVIHDHTSAAPKPDPAPR